MSYLLEFGWFMLKWIDFILLTLITWIAAWLPRFLTRRIYHPLFQVWCRSFCRALGITIRVHQHYATQLPSQYILIANHPSAFEDIGIPAIFPVTSLAKVEVKDWWIVGRISQAAGTLYVKREERESRQAALSSMIAFLDSGRNLAIYPEGGCKGRRLFTHFQRGAFAASMASGVPVLPVFMYYEAQESFEWAGQTLPQKLVELARAVNKQVQFHIFEPLNPKDYDNEAQMRDAAYALYQGWDKRYLD